MESPTSGVFAFKGTDMGIFIVSNIPKGLFATSETPVILAGKGLGNIEYKIPLIGPMKIPHLTFIDYISRNKSQK
jgi:hypothetical protein